MARPRKSPVQVDEQGNEYIDEVVTAQGNTGRVYPPKDWIGCRVRITKLD
jgi:putative transposon-encoded protein